MEEFFAKNDNGRVEAKWKVLSTFFRYSDEEMDVLFADKTMPEMPAGDSSWSDIIKANSGRTY